ncbi:MAG: glycosyltransferase family 87 protein [Planctomycetaceae bacterium]
MTTASRTRWRQIGLVGAIGVLAILAAVYLVAGFHGLLFGSAGDLQRRWVEQGYVARGINPYDVFAAHVAGDDFAHGAAPNRSADIDPRLGLPRQLGYPPWSFLAARFLVVTGSFSKTRLLFAAANAASLVLIAVWACRQGAEFGFAGRCLLPAAALAMFANAVTLRLGQFGILINVLLIGAVALARAGRQVPAGALLGIAALKPQLSAPFGLMFLARRQWWAAGAALAYIIVASLYVGAQVGTNPLVMLAQMQEFLKSEYWNDVHMGLFHPLTEWGVPREAVGAGGLVIGAIASFWLMSRYREQPDLVVMSIAAVVAQLWTYHRRFDQTGLLFLLTALGKQALRERTATVTAAFVLVGLSLWTPHRDVDWQGILPLLQYGIWIFGLIVLLSTTSETPPSGPHHPSS